MDYIFAYFYTCLFKSKHFFQSLNISQIIPGQTAKTFDIPTQLTLYTEGRHRKLLHLSSDKDIAVYVLGASTFGVADAYIVYPTTSQSRAYLLGSHTARDDAP